MKRKPTYEEPEEKVEELEKAVLEHKETDRFILHEGHFYESIIDSLPGVFYLFDNKGKLLRWNKNLEEITGYSPEEISEMNPLDFFVEEDQKNVSEKIQEVFNKGRSSVEASMASKSGSIFPMYLTGQRLMIGKKSCLVGMGIDMSEQKRAEEALRESEEVHRSLAESTEDIIFLVDRNCRCLYLNKEYFLRRDQEAKAQVVGRPFSEFHSKDGTKEFEKGIKEVFKSGRSIQQEYMSKIDGRYYLRTLSPVRKTDGGISYVTVVSKDITERKQTEEALQEAHNNLEEKIDKRTKALKKSEKRLALKNIRLEEANTALKVLLNKRDEDRIELEKSVLLNVKELILPYLEKIKKTGRNEMQNVYADILESNLNEIILPFTHRLSSEFTNLTPAEIKVANLVKQGKTTKEIAELMHLSHRTIQFHRINLRRKLGLNAKKENLRSRLLSIQ